MPNLGALFEALTGAHANLQGLLYMLALSSIRSLVIFTVLPATGSQAIPGAARTGAVYLMTWFVAAGQTPAAFDRASIPELLLLTGKEAFIGLIIGYTASTIFWIAEAAGTLIDDLAGFNNVQMTNPLQGEQSTPVASLLLQLSITLFYVSGGMAVLLGALFESYRWWPLAAGVPDFHAAASDLAIHQGENVLLMAVKICTPIMLALVLIDIGLGVIGRAAGKLEPASLSQPIRGAVAVMLLIALTSAVAVQVRDALHFTGFAAIFSGIGAPGAK
ncbi:type III secretion system export apparatus subunit SctT [Robbsia sp. Bb-Pol-6]|uniref:Type III secretion system export apparatus subunit SctT n=1 Tax=Robbsia betulipollinis TaxID=2981849 RepID=A0ABT3ZKK6_9BURK|nr:type III secretion system export apparatus subunit SctT [Robbsia betulipollinis]MCY0387071.1 type III secretion system export apparatus subunit SctT [Robbsia betulipollinis]